MRSMKLTGQILFLMLGVVISLQAVPPVPYSGKVAINGVNYHGEAKFTFFLQDKEGKVRWRNGTSDDQTIRVQVFNGRYTVLLGGQGMNVLPPQLFLDYEELYLRVRFDNGDGKGLRNLTPYQRITSSPHALVAEVAKVANSVKPGSVNSQMLASDAVTSDKLSPQVRAELSAPIGLNRLSAEVTAKLDQNGSGGSGIAVGSIISFPSGQPAPAGYSLYQQGTPKELVWEEKASVSVARRAFDGVAVLDGKIYFVGGDNSSAKNIAERYDPLNDTWEILSPMSVARGGVASAILNGKLYAIGGSGLSSVEIYDPSTNTWSLGPALPHAVNSGCAIVANENLYHIGGWLNNQNFKSSSMLRTKLKSWTRFGRYADCKTWFKTCLVR